MRLDQHTDLETLKRYMYNGATTKEAQYMLNELVDAQYEDTSEVPDSIWDLFVGLSIRNS